MAIHLLGIRHHGPGSCRNVLNYLQELQPDLILVEGPAEAEALLACVENPQMTPPVALLAYQPDEPQNAVANMTSRSVFSSVSRPLCVMPYRTGYLSAFSTYL